MADSDESMTEVPAAGDTPADAKPNATPRKQAVRTPAATKKTAAAKKAAPRKAATSRSAAKKAAPKPSADAVAVTPAAETAAPPVEPVAPKPSVESPAAPAAEIPAPAPVAEQSGATKPASEPELTRAEAKEAAWRARLSQPVHPPTRGEKLLYWFVHLVLVRGLSRLWFRLEVVDGDWVPAHGPFVVAPVHRSNIDFFLVAAITKTRMRYIGKDTLWKSRPLGRFIGMLGAFPVRRGAADREALRTCIQVIENGEPLVIFPEGTRQSGPEVQPVFDGPAYIAARTGVPLVPVGIGGTEKAMPKGARWIKPHKVVLVVGEPLEPPKGDGTGRASRRAVRELSEQLKTDIQSLFDEAQQRAG